MELTSTINAGGGGGGSVQQQADWAQTDASAVDYIKNKPNLDVYCRKDADNTHSNGVSDTFAKLVYDEHDPSVLMQADRLTVGGDSIKFYHSHRGEAIKELLLQLDDVEKIKRTATAELDGLMSAADKQKITAIEDVIPEQASSSNKLVDWNSLASVATTGSYNDLSDKPDLSGFITNSVDDLTNYYLKSETYTKTEVQQLISAIQQFHYEVYATLPQTGASNVLYLIGPTGTGADKYEEYVYANNDWTKIGDTSIDLSGYVTTEALNTALADYVTSSALSTALAGKEDKMPIVQVASGTTAINAAVNTYYEVAGEVGTLAITLPTPTDLTKLSMVVVHLTAGTTPNVVICSTATIDYSAAYDISAGKEYEINCLFNGDKWVVADMEVV